MKTTAFLSEQPLTSQLSTNQPRPHSSLITPSSPLAPSESIRHILLGNPEAIRQTIHLLHRLRYTETILWSPVLAIEESLVITPAQGEAISLLRKQI